MNTHYLGYTNNLFLSFFFFLMCTLSQFSAEKKTLPQWLKLGQII